MRNRNEFLEEAIVMTKAGTICLLLDTPLISPGHHGRSRPAARSGSESSSTNGA